MLLPHTNFRGEEIGNRKFQLRKEQQHCIKIANEIKPVNGQLVGEKVAETGTYKGK